jgi:hypothetical protein
MTNKEVADLLGISLDYASQMIAEAQTEMPHIPNRKKAEEIYFNAPENSRLERFSLEEWERFSLQEVNLLILQNKFGWLLLIVIFKEVKQKNWPS